MGEQNISENWVTIGSYSDPIKAKLISTALDEAGIENETMDKINEALPMIGMAEVKVRKEDFLAAKLIVEQVTFGDKGYAE